MRLRFIPFEKLPYSDTCWSLIEGPDERVYASACCETISGGTVFVVRYDPRTEELVYLLDVAEAVGEPATTHRGTQCKIHYSMVVADDGIMYGATHLSGPAVGEVGYDPMATFDDPVRSFVGSKLFAFDTKREEVLFTDTLIPWEGCRRLAFDPVRKVLYAVGYPRDHFYSYDVEARRGRDLGRIGTVNPQALWMDNEGRVYTTEDYGHIVMYDPENDSLSTTDLTVPHAPYQDGSHNVVYDVVQVPGTADVVGVSWLTDPYLFRFAPARDGRAARIEDLGPVYPGRTGFEPSQINRDHVGGLLFGADGRLLYSAQVRPTKRDKRAFCELRATDIETGQTEVIAALKDDETGEALDYVSRAVRIGPEHLVLGICGKVPAGVGHVVLDPDFASGPLQETPRRLWG